MKASGKKKPNFVVAVFGGGVTSSNSNKTLTNKSHKLD